MQKTPGFRVVHFEKEDEQSGGVLLFMLFFNTSLYH